jgi:hypothetical protein
MKENIVGFHVPMDVLATVHKGQGLCDIEANLNGNTNREPTEPIQNGMSRRTIDKLQDEVVFRCVWIVASCQSLNQMRMREVSAEVSFAIESTHELTGVSQVIGQEFHGNRKTSRHIVAQVDGTHPAFPNPPQQSIPRNRAKIRIGPPATGWLVP